MTPRILHYISAGAALLMAIGTFTIVLIQQLIGKNDWQVELVFLYANALFVVSMFDLSLGIKLVNVAEGDKDWTNGDYAVNAVWSGAPFVWVLVPIGHYIYAKVVQYKGRRHNPRPQPHEKV